MNSSRKPSHAASRTTFHVDGKIASPVSAGVGGLRICIVDKNVGQDLTLAETVTDDSGTYQVSFADPTLHRRGKEHPDLQARAHAGATFLAASEVRYNATTQETLNIELDEQTSAALWSEHETLTGAVSRHFRGRLGDLRETADQQDITYLANKTGWDARAVALAALADQFSARTRVERSGHTALDPALFYALFRAGLPADAAALYRIDARTVATIWEQASQQGVIPAKLREELPRHLERFQQLAARQALTGPALVGLSPLKDLAAISLGEDPARHQQFADLYTRHRADLPTFWQAVEHTFGEAVAKRLQLDGQLAYLTGNNAPLIQKLHDANRERGLTDTAHLVDAGYYRADRWQKVIGGDAIPPEIPGENDAEKRSRYAELLAAQVRFSFPTAVVAQMVQSGETPVSDKGLAEQVHAFLTEHQGRFELGVQPVQQFIAHQGLEIARAVTREVSRLQRVYQITTSDDAMNALLRKGVDSAYAVMRYPREEFVETFKGEVGGESNARRIHARAQQVHHTVLTLAVAYRTASMAPGIGVHSPAQIVDPAPGPNPNAADVIALTTLEDLYGPQDYCDCEHCRSVLSPAAYLVDLLLFLDRDQQAWDDFRAQWQANHGDAPPADTPLAVLHSRRPDLEQLPLSCENTNTPLPYIDLVNETLEYYVTHQLSLSGYTGHTTDDTATPAELLANPQFVNAKAYETLAGKPANLGDAPPLLPPTPPLPLHQPLESLRRYFDHFAAPLPAVMESLRPDDQLERASASAYGWRDIRMEELRLSRADYALLTDDTLTLQQLYGYPAATPEADVVAKLSNAREFTRRVGISYAELVAILQTRFVNPSAELIPKLERLGVPFDTLKKYKDGALTDEAFTEARSPQVDPAAYGGDINAWVKDPANYAQIMGLLTLTDPAHPEVTCSFDQLLFRYADPAQVATNVRTFEFLRLIRFIRLWKKLGWTIGQTDQAISALYPANQTPDDPADAVNRQRLAAGFLILLPRLGVVKRAMDLLQLRVQKDLEPLLACFTPTDAPGEAARREWLARRLKLSVPEFLLLTQFTDIHPFAAPDPVDPPLLRLIHLVSRLRARSLKPAQALYLLWNQDLSGKSAPADDEITRFARTLRLGFAAIESEFTLAADPDGQIARARMAQVYGGEATEQFFGLIGQQAVADVPYSHGQPTLEQAILDAAPAGIAYDDLRKRLAYTAGAMPGSTRTALKAVPGVSAAFAQAVDDLYTKSRAFFDRYPELLPLCEAYTFFVHLRTSVPYTQAEAELPAAVLTAASGRLTYDQAQHVLSFAGVLDATTRDALKAAAPAALSTAVDNLYAANGSAIQALFTPYPALAARQADYLAANDLPAAQRSVLLATFLPQLKQRRKRQQTVQATGAAAKVAAELVSALLADASVLHAAGDSSRPALDDLAALERPGLAVQFFWRDTATGSVDQTSDAAADLAYAPTGERQLPANPTPGSAISGLWSGYLEAPENGFYNLRIETNPGATVTLALAGAAVPLAQSGGVWSNSAPIELRAGTLYAIALTVAKAKDTLALRWQTSGRGWEVIPARYLYSATLTDHLRTGYLRFRKAAALAGALKLTATELAWFAAHGDYRISGDGWLASLPVTGSPNSATATALLGVLTALLDYAGSKAELAPEDERLLAVLQDPAAATQQPDSLLFALTGWEPTSLTALLTRFGKTSADLAHPDTFQRVYAAYGWAQKLGVPAAALISATTNEPDATTVRDLLSELRTRYAAADWLAVLQPITDELRGLQRDALVAYILHQMRQEPSTAHIDTPDKLFEYFLMDVEMDPCMQTSRIRHALSSVQLFIERCLMNLEPRVLPSSLAGKHWQWMNRYRVWEANRKVFLYPENWLEPELRDDQSPIFKETMSELLQGDITEDRAAEALLNYLAKLDEVAKLEPCGIHYVEADPALKRGDVAHVVARTAGAKRKYFYRRREYGYWTPWEPIKLDIEDDPVVPFVWNDRLLLFWLKITKDAAPQQPPAVQGDITKVSAEQLIPQQQPQATVRAILCWSEFYNGKWQPTRTSDPTKPPALGQYNLSGSQAFDRSTSLSLAFSVVQDTLEIHIGGRQRVSFTLYNTHSLPVGKEDPHPLHQRPPVAQSRFVSTKDSTLAVTYSSPQHYHNSALHRDVLHNPLADRTVVPLHQLYHPWDAPFLYEDSRNVFYVSTVEHLVKIPEWRGYAPIDVTVQPNLVLPPLVLQVAPPFVRPVPLPDPYSPATKQPGFGASDPSPIARFVSEDAYIRRGIGSLGTVQFGNSEIGPAGRLKGSIQQP